MWQHEDFRVAASMTEDTDHVLFLPPDNDQNRKGGGTGYRVREDLRKRHGRRVRRRHREGNGARYMARMARVELRRTEEGAGMDTIYWIPPIV